MKNIILSIISIICSVYSFADNYRLLITFSASDCINCSMALNGFELLNKKIIKTIILKTEDKNVFEEFRSGLSNFNATSNLKIVYSDSLFNESHKLPPLSTCIFLIGDKEVLLFNLKDFFNYYKRINVLSNDFVYDTKNTSPLNDINISERINVTIHDNTIFIYDYLLNKIIYTNYEELVAFNPKFITIKPDIIKKNDLMKVADLDTNVYYPLLPLFKWLNKDKVRFENLYYDNDTLHTLTLFNYPTFNKTDTIINNYFFITRFTSQSAPSSVFIDKFDFKKRTSNYIDNTLPFLYKEGSYHISVSVDSVIEGRTNILSVWKIKDNMLFYKDMDPFITPKTFNKNKILFDKTTAYLCDKIYFYSAYPYIIDFSRSKAFDLGNIFETLENKIFFNDSIVKKHLVFFLQSVLAKENILLILYFVDRAPKIAYYDITSDKILYHRSLTGFKDAFLPSLIFIDEKTVFGIDNSRKNYFLLK